MAKQSKIRWRARDLAELERTLNNFNAKVYRTKKNKPEIADFQPKRVSKKDAIANITTREEYNRFIAQHKAYSQRGAEKPLEGTRKNGVKLTEWEAKKFKEDEAIKNKIKQKELDNVLDTEVKIGGVGQGTTKRQNESIKELSMLPSNKDPAKMSQKEYEKAVANIDRFLNDEKRLERKLRMRDNYLKGLRDAGFLDADPELETLIKAIDIDEFVTTELTDTTATFTWYKDPQAFEVRLEQMKASWETAYRNSVNFVGSPISKEG